MYRRPGRKTWCYSLDDDHKHISLGTDDEEEASKRFGEILRERRATGLALAERTFAEIVKMTCERAKVNHSPKYAYDATLKLLAIQGWMEDRGALSCRSVTAELVEAFKSDRRGTLKNSSINRYLDVWRKAMKVAVEQRSAAPSSLDLFKHLREARPEPHQRGLTKREIVRFLRAVDDRRYRALFRTVIGTGVRDDEARHLDAADIRKDAIVITPKEGWTTKNYRHRSIPASAATVKAAREYVAAKPGMVLDAKSVWRRLQDAASAAKLAWHISMHDFRRAWGSHLIASGVKLANVSRWYGHADIQTTMRYLRIVEDERPNPKDLPW
jgi:integrase